jgi:hypothetical protein
MRMIFPCPEDTCRGEGGGYGAARAGWRPLPPPAQTPALYTTGGALSHQLAKEREEDVKLHPDGGPSPTSSDSGSVHNWRCTFSSTCQGEGGCVAAWSGWRPLPHQLRLRLCTQLAVHFLIKLPRRGRRMWSCTVWMEASPPPAQTPALYTSGPSPTSSDSGSVHTSGGALSPQPAKEREEDVKLHGPDGGPSPTSSDSDSVHNWRCTFSSTCQGEGGGCGAA